MKTGIVTITKKGDDWTVISFNGQNEHYIWGSTTTKKDLAEIAAKATSAYSRNMEYISPEQKLISIIEHPNSYSVVSVEFEETSIKTTDVFSSRHYLKAFEKGEKIAETKALFQPTFFLISQKVDLLKYPKQK